MTLLMSENFVRRTEKSAGQSVRQLKIFISKLEKRLIVSCSFDKQPSLILYAVRNWIICVVRDSMSCIA